jgi:peptidyl-prolyl cis-trans isomerase C
MTMHRSRYLIPLIGLTLLAGCGGEQKAQLQDVSVASLGAENVTEEDFAAYLKLKGIPNTPGDRLDRARKTFSERNAMAESIAKEDLLDKAALNAELRDFRNELLITRYFEKFLTTTVSDAEVRKYYDENPDKFSQRRAHLSHILLRVTPEMDEVQRRNQFNKAVDLHSKIKAGASFESVARDASEDTLTATRGGDLGWLSDTQMERAVADAVFAAEKGTLLQPVNTSQGYQIVRVIEDPVVDKQPFEQVAESVRYRLQVEKKSKEMARLSAAVTPKEPS